MKKKWDLKFMQASKTHQAEWVAYFDILTRQSCGAGRQKDSLNRRNTVTKTLVSWLCGSGYITPCICRSRKTLEHR